VKYLKFHNILVNLLLCTLTVTHAQQTKGVSPSEANTAPVSLSKTWAVIIGISDYQNNDVPDLSYANRDATAFADFLKSPGVTLLTLSSVHWAARMVAINSSKGVR